MARELRPKEQHYIVLRRDRLGWSADLRTASGRVMNTINGDRKDSLDRVLRAARTHWPDALYARQSRDNGNVTTRKRRGPEDRGMKLTRMIAKFQPAGRRMNPEEKLEWRLARLRWALDRDGIPYRDAFREVLVDQMIKEDHRADAARYRRAYGGGR